MSSSQDPGVTVVEVVGPEKDSVVGRVVTSSSSTHDALGSRHEKPPFRPSPHVKKSVLTQVHSQQSPPS